MPGPDKWRRRMKKTRWTSSSPAQAVLLPTMQCRSAWPSTRTGGSASHRCRPSGTAWVHSRQGGGRSCRGWKSKATPTAETPNHLPQWMALQKLAPRQIMGERNPEQWKCGPRTIRLGDSIWAWGWEPGSHGFGHELSYWDPTHPHPYCHQY